MANPKYTPVAKSNEIPYPTAKPAPVGEKVFYYRIRKITAHLTELLEISVDEAAVTPKVIGKADLPMLIQDKAMTFLYPSVDDLEKRARLKKEAERKAADEARGNK